MGNIKVGQIIAFNGESVQIVEKIKGKKTKTPVLQNGATVVGMKSKPPSYILSNGMRVKGETIVKSRTTPTKTK